MNLPGCKCWLDTKETPVALNCSLWMLVCTLEWPLQGVLVRASISCTVAGLLPCRWRVPSLQGCSFTPNSHSLSKIIYVNKSRLFFISKQKKVSLDFFDFLVGEHRSTATGNMENYCNLDLIHVAILLRQVTVVIWSWSISWSLLLD